MLLKQGTLLLLFALSTLVACSIPDEKIASATKNDACSQNLVDALATFASEMDLPIHISQDDARAIFDHGEIAKTYGRDGFKYTVTFGLETKEDGCNLVYYKQKKVGPGYESTSRNDYGSVLLTDCECESNTEVKP